MNAAMKCYLGRASLTHIYKILGNAHIMRKLSSE